MNIDIQALPKELQADFVNLDHLVITCDKQVLSVLHSVCRQNDDARLAWEMAQYIGQVEHSKIPDVSGQNPREYYLSLYEQCLKTILVIGVKAQV